MISVSGGSSLISFRNSFSVMSWFLLCESCQKCVGYIGYKSTNILSQWGWIILALRRKSSLKYFIEKLGINTFIMTVISKKSLLSNLISKNLKRFSAIINNSYHCGYACYIFSNPFSSNKCIVSTLSFLNGSSWIRSSL